MRIKEIYYCLSIKTGSDKIFRAISTRNGIAGWWTKNLDHTGTVGSISTFRFSSGAFNKMKIIKAESNYIEWLCVDGHKEWIDTHIMFKLSSVENGTKVCFSHFGFNEQTEYVGECSFHWAKYMISLQQFCEIGKGMPNEGRK